MSDRRQSFRDYLLEGAMIFVAVSLGFMADSLREYLADRDAERAYMQAMAEDLRVDSVRLADNIARLRRNLANSDSLVHEFIAGRSTGRYAPAIAEHGRDAGNSVDLVFNDRTASQLKGTGAMRLVRDSATASALLVYWNNQERLHEIHDRFESLRMEHRKVGWRAFNWYQPVYARFRTADPVITQDRPSAIADAALVPEFVNTTSSMFMLTNVMFLPELEAELALAGRLRALIRAAYP
jgi:hypothetical protein